MKKYEKPVHLTFNSLYYIPEQYPEIAGIISQCMKIGSFDSENVVSTSAGVNLTKFNTTNKYTSIEF